MRSLRNDFWGAALSLSVFAFSSSCASSQHKQDVEVLKKSYYETQRQLADVKLQLSQLAAHLENVERSLWSDKYCQNPKNSKYAAKIAEFLNQLQAQIPGTCSAESTQAALVYVNNEPYMVAMFDPKASVDDLHFTRLGYLKTKLLAPKYIRPSTRILILVQPAEETEASQQSAMQMGKEYINMLYEKKLLPNPGPRVIGPHLLPCRLNAEIRRVYKGPMDSPLPMEPREGTPQVKIWTFRSDC